MNEKYLLVEAITKNGKFKKAKLALYSERGFDTWMRGGLAAFFGLVGVKGATDAGRQIARGNLNLGYRKGAGWKIEYKGGSKLKGALFVMSAIITGSLLGTLLGKAIKRHIDSCEGKCSKSKDPKICFNQCYAEGAKRNLQIIKRDIQQATKLLSEKPKKRDKIIKALKKELVHYTEVYNKAKRNKYNVGPLGRSRFAKRK